MAAYETELVFLGQWFNAATFRDRAAWDAVEIVQPGMIENAAVDRWFGIYSGRFVTGQPLHDPEDRCALAAEIADARLDEPTDIRHLAERIRNDWRARRQVDILRSALTEADKAIASTNGKARKVAERLSTALLDLFADSGEHGRPHDLESMLANELELMSREEEPGIALPFSKLEDACGPWLPGDVVGLSAYSNGGKSTFAANLAAGWCRRGVPVIAFPTEMRELWLARLLAAEARVPQRIAEKRRWKRASAEDRVAYEAAIERVRNWPLQVVNRPDISAAEIIAATRVLRRQWAGRTVVVVVDHMHRLNYGKETSNEAVGQATKALKNFAGVDADGLILLLLFQPRKPGVDVYRPIAGHEIRGDSAVWNEIDVHLSPFRAWVKTDPHRTTRWGTPAAMYDHDWRPKITKPESEGSKLTDEHVFVKIDKQRVGGEGPTVWLDFEGPTGRMMEIEDRYRGDTYAG